MRPAHWLLLTLGTLACGSPPDGPESDRGLSEESADAPVTARDGGSKKPPPARQLSREEPKEPEEPTKQASCDKLALLAEPKAPEILIVLDRSTSMVLAVPERWTPSASAVKTLTVGLEHTVRFGLMLYPEPGLAACAPGKVSVPPALKSAATIAGAIDRGPPLPFPIGATPTGASLEAALVALDPGAACIDQCRASAGQYVVLVTDGQPTCGANAGTNTDPEDIADAHRALDALLAAGVKTFVVGYGTRADPGLEPVMTGFAQHGGTDKSFSVENEQELVAELTRIVGALVPCEYELQKDIEDPKYIRVQIDGVSYEYEKDWRVEGRKIVLEPDAPACKTLRDAKVHELDITKECQPVEII